MTLPPTRQKKFPSRLLPIPNVNFPHSAIYTLRSRYSKLLHSQTSNIRSRYSIFRLIHVQYLMLFLELQNGGMVKVISRQILPVKIKKLSLKQNSQYSHGGFHPTS